MLAEILFATWLSLVSAQSDCCSPDQWEAIVGFVEGKATPGDPEANSGLQVLHYDFTNQRIALLSQLPNSLDRLKVIAEYNKGVQYTIQIDKELCAKKQITPPMPRACPDPLANKLPQVTFGSGADISKVHVYLRTTPELTNSFVWTEDLCVPFAQTRWGILDPETGVSSMQVFGWQNLTLGINDPAAFDIPAYCNTDLKQGENEVKLSRSMQFLLDPY